MYRKHIKRAIDVICALLALVVFSWLYLLIAILVRSRLGRPVFFKQERAGLNNRPFCLYKFRTMSDTTNENGQLLPDKQRVTKLGSFLRSTSLDELPEAWNILKGDMSVVGPRPLPLRYLPFYTDIERCRHDVRPGLTGYAQIFGRSYVTWEKKFELDLCYIRDFSFFMDMSIVFKTIREFIRRKNVANVSAMEYDENGRAWIIENGAMRSLHRPLDVERGSPIASGNR